MGEDPEDDPADDEDQGDDVDGGLGGAAAGRLLLGGVGEGVVCGELVRHRQRGHRRRGDIEEELVGGPRRARRPVHLLRGGRGRSPASQRMAGAEGNECGRRASEIRSHRRGNVGPICRTFREHDVSFMHEGTGLWKSVVLVGAHMTSSSTGRF